MVNALFHYVRPTREEETLQSVVLAGNCAEQCQHVGEAISLKRRPALEGRAQDSERVADSRDERSLGQGKMRFRVRCEFGFAGS